jgi:dihydroorotate dehydrogenase electron transfer subunit
MYQTSLIVSNKKISQGFNLISIQNKELASVSKAGQFYMLTPYKKEEKNSDLFLKRPISIFNIDTKNGVIEFFYKIEGRGSVSLSELKRNDQIEILGPLGRGFRTDLQKEKILMVGAGVGIAPFYYLYKVLKPHNHIYLAFGGRNKETLAVTKYFKAKNHLNISSDDGSIGEKENVVELTREVLEEHKKNPFTYLFVCGPTPVLKAAGQVALDHGLECQLSLEKRMACGVRACMACSIKTKNGIEKVCNGGPVFNVKNLILEEL